MKIIENVILLRQVNAKLDVPLKLVCIDMDVRLKDVMLSRVSQLNAALSL